MNDAGSEEIVELVSPVAFEATLARLQNAMEAAGLNLFFRFDHAANAREADPCRGVGDVNKNCAAKRQ